MRKFISACCVLLILGACSNMSRQDQAALSAGTIGGAAGLVVGLLAGAPFIGAAIGAAGGAAYGAMREGD